MSTSVSTGGLGCWAGPGLLPLLLLAPPSAVGCLGIPPAARAQLRHQLSTARNFLPSAAELGPAALYCGGGLAIDMASGCCPRGVPRADGCGDCVMKEPSGGGPSMLGVPIATSRPSE